MATIQTKINEKYILCHDEYQWWFAKPETWKDGGFKAARITGYFRDLSGAFEDLGKREARSLEADTIEELIQALKEHEKVMRSLAVEIQEVLRNEV